MAKRTRHQWRADETGPRDDDREPSRAEKKRQADRLTQLGARLTELNARALAGLEMHDELRAAIETCRSLKRGNARARQTRLVGKLLRVHDTDALIEALVRMTHGVHEKAAIAKVQEDQRATNRPTESD